MVVAAFILICVLIGWLLPQWLVPRLPRRLAIAAASMVALGLGAGVVWVCAQLFGVLGIEAADSAFARGFKAWKIMLLVAPASALHARRGQEAKTSRPVARRFQPWPRPSPHRFTVQFRDSKETCR